MKNLPTLRNDSSFAVQFSISVSKTRAILLFNIKIKLIEMFELNKRMPGMRSAECQATIPLKFFIIIHNYANVQTINQSKSLPGFRVVVTSLDGINGWSIQTLLRGENDSKQSEIQARNQVDEEPLSGCATAKSLFISLFILRCQNFRRFRDKILDICKNLHGLQGNKNHIPASTKLVTYIQISNHASPYFIYFQWHFPCEDCDNRTFFWSFTRKSLIRRMHYY